ncbi:hypothetical protein [Cellulomonas composti]|uniref:DUF8094 domain-containing protein n=1 Tax=Cellulomonas composti TaxID=266130 RepID=A0A511JC48_9CELL|nr:hypothetical protein [Cellulomonas composti]GEL95577.1 hypothetical protein CCO02nite_22350 [Cellulomonas composti]
MSRLRTTSSRRVTRLRGAALAAAALVGLAACAGSPPQPDPPPPPAIAPAALTVAQSDRVLDSLGDVLAAADGALDAAALAPRVEGPALAMRSAEYVRSTATAGAKPPTVLPAVALTSVVPQTTQWPRTQLVVTEQPEDLQAPRILVLRQDEPRAPYRMWGWARLLPGTQMPPTAPADEGSEVLEPDDDSLSVAPQDVLPQFADLLAKGDGSMYKETFAESAYQTEIEDLRTQASAGIGTAGSAASTYTPSGDESALRTVDGGAIVVGDLTVVSTITISAAGATIPITDPFYAAISGATSATHSFVRTYTSIVTFYVPPAGSDAPLQVLAAELVLTAASAT